MKKHFVISLLLYFIVGFVSLFLLTMALVHGIISPREQAIGMLVWAVAMCALLAFLGRRLAKLSGQSLGLSVQDSNEALSLPKCGSACSWYCSQSASSMASHTTRGHLQSAAQ